MVSAQQQLVIITGMSGAGKSVAMRSFEDMGYYCVDNLPPALLPKFFELIEESSSKMTKAALVMDLRGREFFDQLFEVLDKFDKENSIHPTILYLDAKSQVLVSRYKETRRSHPLAANRSPLVGIEMERKMLEELKGRAQQIIDTTNLSPRQLRETILDQFLQHKDDLFTMNIVSFGFKYGIPIDADLVFDVRFLPNPHYIESMRPKTGMDDEVSSYVLKFAETQAFIEKLTDLLHFMLPYYKREGKSQLILAIGCTGGQHRSVTLAEYIGNHFDNEYKVRVNHRDAHKRKAGTI
ncbi:RNase adapter RapZ [Aureibacillus halotolerans]|uniref:UPF0042 nucleotide-binding protein n=1 Tax=Aureibacillus halotolerans TaxID=1508390 RepID=A0A4R6TY76_9BACI|nr:RNase adapter RapZ [Aureibacillus halotolerans]TDQ36979.1 UPF0042 nucleotide-binding protein [Aureibacillus halotolerans]